MSKHSAWKVQDLLNRLGPGAAEAGLGDILNDLVTAYNDLRAQYVALLTKLDADAGVTDTNYHTVAAPSVAAVTTLLNR